MWTKDLPNNVKIAVAVSGGADSVALLDRLVCVALEKGFSLLVVHCEHGIRGAESLADAEFVRGLAEEYGLEFVLFSEDCPALAKRLGIGLEEAARTFRYRCFERLLSDGKAEYIALAHHKDDGAETALFRLCRGTSLGGVLGMSAVSGRYLRPLLGERKQEILRYVAKRGLQYREDSTNFERDAARNRIRLDVLPALEEAVPGAKENLIAFGVRAKEDDEYLYSLAKEWLEISSPASKGDSGWSVGVDAPPPLFRRACLTVMKTLGIEKNYTQKHLLALQNLCNLQTGARVDLPQGVFAERSYQKIRFYTGDGEEYAPCIPFACGRFSWGRYELTVSRTPLEGVGVLRLDEEKIPAGGEIRTRREGDTFHKFGGGRKSLKKYLIDIKLPKRQREELPLLADGEEILAVFGVEISERVKVDNQTKKILYLAMNERE
ncbi:MAG: tRNA lysidine(34) synthetase TilS [Clostridia bacterium]|nr:tRNA lysidine(34) synthetase TilS [Clostridia bacterium]